MWKNIVEPAWLQMAMWRVRIACWILKATNTHSECVILIASPLQQWWDERASALYVHNMYSIVRLTSQLR